MFVVTLIKDGFQASGAQLTDSEPKNLAPEEARDVSRKLGLKSVRMETSGETCEVVFQIIVVFPSFLDLLAGGRNVLNTEKAKAIKPA